MILTACLILAMPPKFRVLALYENGGHHLAYSQRAKIWLDELAKKRGFAIDYFNDTKTIDPKMLAGYEVFLQLDYPPYAWEPRAAKAFEEYVDQGKGGWIGFHHATLLGEFDGHPMWTWFHDFMGGIRFKDYIAGFAEAIVKVEVKDHPIFKGVPPTFTIKRDEWYTYDRSPRPNVQVLGNVDESTYKPESDKRMGDHPVIWSNPRKKGRNVYIFMGHGPDLFDNKAYTTLFENTIFWAANK